MRAIERLAAKIIGQRDGWIPDQCWLVAECVNWLAHEVGAVMVSMKGEDWIVQFTDHDDDLKLAKFTGVTLAHSLSMAVVCVGKKRGDLDPPRPYEEFRKEIGLS